MILVVDDDADYANAVAGILRERGYAVATATSASAFLGVIEEPGAAVDCVILDIMMPCGDDYSETATADGKYTGMQLFASLRSRLPNVPVFVTTVIRDSHILGWLDGQTNCQVFLKPFDMSKLVRDVENILHRLGPSLLRRLADCAPGWSHFRQYEDLCADALEFLFVPPLPDITLQSRTEDGHEIRDAVLLNHGTAGFWGEVRTEFGCNNIPCEFKNYREPIGTREVQQLRIRLDKPSLGRFGLILSRMPPSEPARIERRNAYVASPTKLMLFIDDDTLVEMVRVKSHGDHPERILQRLKTDFELGL